MNAMPCPLRYYLLDQQIATLLLQYSNLYDDFFRIVTHAHKQTQTHTALGVVTKYITPQTTVSEPDFLDI